MTFGCHNWATAWDFQQFNILTSVESDEPLQPAFKLRNSKWCSVSSLTIIKYSSNQQRLWSDCAYAQADLRFSWEHIPHCWKSHALAHMSLLDLTKSVLGFYDKVRLKPSSAIVTSYKIENLLVKSLYRIPANKQKTQALIRLRENAGWSAPLEFTNTKDRFSHTEAFMIVAFISLEKAYAKIVWSGNTTIKNCRQTNGAARKCHTTITRHRGRQIKQSNQLSLPHQYDCNTRIDIK